jgi:hypothetical protein
MRGEIPYDLLLEILLSIQQRRDYLVAVVSIYLPINHQR